MTERHRTRLGASGLAWDSLEVLSFTFDYNRDSLAKKLTGQNELVITSGRAVQALDGHALPSGTLQRKTFVVGNSSAAKLSRMGFTDITSAQNSEDLIHSAKWNTNRRLLYLCGNLRRNLLPDFWKREGIAFDEFEVYQTHLLCPVVEVGRYDYALVSSPSCVRSLTENNVFPSHFLFASMGPVTSAVLREAGFHNVIEAPEISFDALISTLETHLT